MGKYEPIVYTYEADYHCPACTIARFGADEYGNVPDDAVDSEGNPIGAMWEWDEHDSPLLCGTCLQEIEGD